MPAPAVVEQRYEQAYDDAVGEMESVPGLDATRMRDDPERRFEVLMGLAEGRRRSDDFAGARDIYDLAIDEARRLQSTRHLAEAVLGMAAVMVEVGVSHQPLIDLIRHAAAGLDPDDPLRVDLHAALVPELVWSGDWDAAMALSRSIADAPPLPTSRSRPIKSQGVRSRRARSVHSRVSSPSEATSMRSSMPLLMRLVMAMASVPGLNASRP